MNKMKNYSGFCKKYKWHLFGGMAAAVSTGNFYHFFKLYCIGLFIYGARKFGNALLY